MNLFLIVPSEVPDDQHCDARKKEKDFVIEFFSGDLNDSIEKLMHAMKPVVTVDLDFKCRVR